MMMMKVDDNDGFSNESHLLMKIIIVIRNNIFPVAMSLELRTKARSGRRCNEFKILI